MVFGAEELVDLTQIAGGINREVTYAWMTYMPWERGYKENVIDHLQKALSQIDKLKTGIEKEIARIEKGGS